MMSLIMHGVFWFVYLQNFQQVEKRNYCLIESRGPFQRGLRLLGCDRSSWCLLSKRMSSAAFLKCADMVVMK